MNEQELFAELEAWFPQWLESTPAKERSGFSFWCYLEYVESVAFDDSVDTLDMVSEWVEERL